MSKFTRLREVYARGGLSELVKRGLVETLVYSGLSSWIRSLLGETLHLKLYMYLSLGYWPRIRSPRTFNEKIAHRKVYTDNPLFTTVEDKYRVRQYVEKKVGDEILPRLYCVTGDPESIPFEKLPEKYVIKPTHMSGPIIFSDQFDVHERDSIIEECNSWLSTTYGETKLEYWYENIEPQIIVEEQLQAKNGDVPLDFKFFVFHGQVEYIEVHFDRFIHHKRRIYNKNWGPQDVEFQDPLGPEISPPNNLERMIELSESLGSDFEFIRVDLYEVEGDRVVFGELTVAPGSGADKFIPQEYDFEFGSLW